MNDLPEKIARWRERLIERGWLDPKIYPPPDQDVIVYHVVWNGEIWSGRCRLRDHHYLEATVPGTHQFLMFAYQPEAIPVRLWRMAPGSD